MTDSPPVTGNRLSELSVVPEHSYPGSGSSRPAVGSLLSPLDPVRQAKRLHIRLLKMLTAHTGHLLHPEYLQPLMSAPVSIELDAKKSPLAMLAQTCSQIGKNDSPSSKMGSSCDRESNQRPSISSLKIVDHRAPLDDKCSFKPYNKGPKDSNGVSNSDKIAFRVPNNNSSSHQQLRSPSPKVTSSTPPQQKHSPHASQPSVQSISEDSGPEASSPTSTKTSNTLPPKETGKSTSESPHIVPNSTHIRTSSTSSSEDPSHPDGGKTEPSNPRHIVSPFKSSQPIYPLPDSNLGYHGSVVGAYTGYSSHFDPKSSLVVPPSKHPNSSPLTGASPPSFIQSLCRDPYCLSYPPHLGGGTCNSCLPDSSLKFPIMYPSHSLHPLHPCSLSSTSSLSHPLYSYSFMLPNDPLPHACNWVSASGPCDKRFATSNELLSHLRSHTDSKLLSSASSSASCHLHLPHQTSPGSMALRAPPSLGLSRYHPYSKVHMPPGPPSLSLHSLPTTNPYYPPYALYGQRLGSASTLGYQ